MNCKCSLDIFLNMLMYSDKFDLMVIHILCVLRSLAVDPA